MTQEEYGTAYQYGFPRTARLLRYRGASIDVAQDLSQAAWLRGWEKLDQLRDDQMVLGWVNTIAINLHRRGAVQAARFQPLKDTASVTGLDLAPFEVGRILDLCTPWDRRLLEQTLNGLSTKEIAKTEHVSPAAIRVRLFRARRSVRDVMESRASRLHGSVAMRAVAS